LENYNNLIRNRNMSVNINAALCNESRTLHYVNFGRKGTRGIFEFMSPTLLKSFYQNLTVSNLPKVQCHRLDEILRRMNIRHIDLWVLDVEGAEESVLEVIKQSIIKMQLIYRSPGNKQGMKFRDCQVDAILMECAHYEKQKNARKISLLESYGYSCERVKLNRFCVRRGFNISSSSTVINR